MPKRTRLIVLTDINHGREVDDIQSLVRLLLYSNEIDIEGLIACTSCWHKKSTARDLRIIHSVIATYGQIVSRLNVHAIGYPSPSYLHSIAASGITEYGAAAGNGFNEERFTGVTGVRIILDALTRNETRPLWFALWGGGNTLAQALWQAETQYPEADFNHILAKVRIHAISDQDHAVAWIRKRYGDSIFFIGAPSSPEGGNDYKYATWPGISADTFTHGSEDGISGGGFLGAPRDLVSRRWLLKNIRNHRPYGKKYPIHLFIMEGDTPSHFNLIPNGLSDPEHPDWGGWGGRYAFGFPKHRAGREQEKYPLWIGCADTVHGIDGRTHTSPQATIWRWREAMQNDFAARMQWTTAATYGAANHPPIVNLMASGSSTLHPGDSVTLSAAHSADPDGDELSFRWFVYPEAGTASGCDIHIDGAFAPTATVHLDALSQPGTLHVIVEVADNGTPRLTRYGRFILAAHAI
ncbi:MAG: DUF1593 domain-containing protein [Ancrocorticia sp.]|nr:DUF1593 domain-containing protein [Ancrocorticia sp.]MCI2193306.1 DUF1593 domain-containing protein [Ancrocorticia sp.]MCI2198735.1 DUF1593 domain-containing protein [Ancrocorticia sp.]